MRQLRRVGRYAGELVEMHLNWRELTVKGEQGPPVLHSSELQKAAEAYSKSLGPWARVQAAKMLEKISAANKRAMRANARAIGQGTRLIVDSAVGAEAAKLMEEQVDLIKSIPLKAAERAQKLALEAVFNGKRADYVVERLKKSKGVAEADAILIARTEVARANSILTQARATAVGSTHYIWRTSKDSAVRHSHREMEGKVIAWDSPPTLSDGTTGHAGTFPNCRCYPEPVFTEQPNRRNNMLKAAVFVTAFFAMLTATLHTSYAAATPAPQLILKNNFGEQTVNSVINSSESVIAAGALSTLKYMSKVSNVTAGTFAVTLAAPAVSQDGQVKVIKAVATMSHTVTLALTNVLMSGGYTPTGTTTLTFTNAGDCAVFIAVGGKWVYLGGSAVAS